MAPRDRVHDIVIVGAGPAGSSTAHYLARYGLDVLLLDKAKFPRDKTCGDGLTPRALAILDDMGILNKVLQMGHCIYSVEVTAPNGHTISAAFPQQPAMPDHALVIPRRILDDVIRRQALASGARFRGRVSVTGLEPAPHGVTIAAEEPGSRTSFKARMAVIATGADIKLLRRMGLLSHPPPMMLAARAYFEELRGGENHFHFRFDGVPLPGYGWVFPLSETVANVGLGVFPGSGASRRTRLTPRATFDAFIRTPALAALMGESRPIRPVMGYPLRIDFLTAPTFAERVLLVGEAAGLVNPLTGEGIDYALESGKLAAGHLAQMFAAGDFSHAQLEAYDRLLRRHFQPLFRFCERVRALCLNRVCLNGLVWLAGRRRDLTSLLIDIVLGYQAVPEHLSWRQVMKILLAR